MQGNNYHHMDSHLVKKRSEDLRGEEEGGAGRMSVGSGMSRALGFRNQEDRAWGLGCMQ